MKKIVNRITAVIIAAVMATSVAISASAEETTDYITAHTSNGDTILLLPNESNDTTGVSAREVTKPETEKSLINNDYLANLAVVSPTQWLYTNYYFKCSSDGKLYVKYKVKRTAYYDDVKLNISVYDLTTNTSYDAFFTSGLPITGYLTDQMYFSGLTQGHNYAIRFKAYWEVEASTITGKALIGHDHITDYISID